MLQGICAVRSSALPVPAQLLARCQQGAFAAPLWYADCLARAGQIEHATEVLTAIDPNFVTDVDHDGYWLATLSMLADAAHLTNDASMGAAMWQSLRPVTHLTIVDPGLIYRGAAAHAAGLAATVCGRRRDATELLSIGLSQHEMHLRGWSNDRVTRSSRSRSPHRPDLTRSDRLGTIAATT
jgi:hypothetical protein